jgi:hypothetical protein
MTFLNIYFILFESIVFILFVYALWDTWQQGVSILWQFVAGIFFGLMLELATINQLEAYEYGRFMIMIGDVPLVIAVSWGLIIYSARKFSEATNLPEWAQPFMEALLALNIDLSMDAIAIRLEMWDWGQGFQVEYFGVPWANFWAWFWVVFFFSAGLRIFRRFPGLIGQWLAPLGAILIGLIGVLSTNSLIAFVLFPTVFYEIVIVAVLMGAVTLLIILRPKLHENPVSSISFWVPMAFHGYFTLVGIISGVILQPIFLLFSSLGMALVAFWLHRPYIAGLTKR